MSSAHETGRFANIRPDEVDHVATNTDAADIVGRMAPPSCSAAVRRP